MSCLYLGGPWCRAGTARAAPTAPSSVSVLSMAVYPNASYSSAQGGGGGGMDAVDGGGASRAAGCAGCRSQSHSLSAGGCCGAREPPQGDSSGCREKIRAVSRDEITTMITGQRACKFDILCANAGRPAGRRARGRRRACWNGCGYSCVHGEFGDGGVTVRPGGLVPRGRRAVNGAGGGFLELDRRGTGSCPPPSLPPVVT